MTDRPTLQPRQPWRPSTDRPPEPRVEVYRATGAWGRVVEVTRDLDTNERSYREICPADPPPQEQRPEAGSGLRPLGGGFPHDDVRPPGRSVGFSPTLQSRGR